MSTDELEALDLPADFEQRCTTVYARLQAGEPMTIEYLADQLGMSYEVFAVACASYAAARGVLALVDFGPGDTVH